MNTDDKVCVDPYANPVEWNYKDECGRLQEANRFLYKENVSLQDECGRLRETIDSHKAEIRMLTKDLSVYQNTIDEQQRKIDKYELVIHAFEAFVGQKIL